MVKLRDRQAADALEEAPAGSPAPTDEDVLGELLGAPASEREKAIWTLMDADQRDVAMRRARAFNDWNSGRGDRSAERVAERAGLKTVRFYQLNARWRDERSLANLGTGAAPARTRRSRAKAEVVNAAQSIVPRLIEANDGASVRQLAIRLGEEIARRTGLDVKDLPGHNTLRTFVERERQRRQREGRPGNDLVFDHVAGGVLRPDGTPYTLFLLLDRNSHLILGAAVGGADDVGRGYRAAAADALVRIVEAGPFSRLPWVERVARVELVPDGEGGFGDGGRPDPGAGIGLAVTAPGAVGSYVARYVGRAIDAIPLWRSRTGGNAAPPHLQDLAPRLDAVRAAARIRVAVDRHDAAMLETRTRGGRPPPPDLLERLRRLSG